MKNRFDNMLHFIRPSRRQILAAGGAATAALYPGFAAAAIAETDEAALIAGMTKEGPPMIYSSMDPQMFAAVTDAFKKKYQIKVDMLHLVSAPLGQKFTAEMQSGNIIADVLIVSDQPIVHDATTKKWTQPPSGIPALATWPKDAIFENGIIGAFNPHSIAWNTSLVPKGISRTEDLIDPSLKGRILLSDPRIELAPLQWYAMLLDAYGEEFLRKLGQQAHFQPSVATGTQLLAAGSMAVYAPCANNPVVALKRQGAPIEQAFIPPVLLTGFMGMLVSGAHHPNGARLFLNYWMSPEGQAASNKEGYSPLPNIPGTLPVPQHKPSLSMEQIDHLQPKILNLLGIA